MLCVGVVCFFFWYCYDVDVGVEFEVCVVECLWVEFEVEVCVWECGGCEWWCVRDGVVVGDYFDIWLL